MENKINLVELLKDCPKGMELDCTVYNNVTLEYVCNSSTLPICIRIQDRGTMFLSKYGQFHDEPYCKCIIFPKGKTTWEGFQRPAKDGDVVVCEEQKITQMFIVQSERQEGKGKCYFGYDFERNDFFKEGIWEWDRLATEEEKQKLFDAIKAHGWRWNAETKTLEKLIEPKFKIGDRIKKKDSEEDVVLITDIVDDYYIVETQYGMEITININIQNNYELVPNKFDITTLTPFDSRVLVRDGDCDEWRGALWGYLREKRYMKYDTSRGVYRQCIPYNDDTKHLLGKTDDCDEYFKTWENNHGNK